MKYRMLILGILMGSLMAITSCKQSDDPVRILDRKYREVIKESRDEAIFYMARSNMPGSSLAVSLKGKLIWSEGYGLASTDLDVPAGRYTKYRIGEMSQILTALGYHILVEEGKLDPEATVQQYLPEFPDMGFPLKLKNLVDQTSGIRLPTDEELNWRGLNVGIQKGIETFMNDSLLFPPGEYQYPTIYAYNLLGAVMEKAEQKHFQNIIQEKVLDTLGLKNIQPDNPLITVKGRTNYYDRDLIAQTINATFRDLRYRLPSDGYLSSVEDLVKLGNALLYSTNLPENVKNRMFTPARVRDMETNIGNGLLFLSTSNGEKFYASRGNITGGGSMLLIYPKEELVVAWAGNINDHLDELPGMIVANNFRDWLNGKFKTREEKMKEEEQERARKEQEMMQQQQEQNQNNPSDEQPSVDGTK